LDGRTLLATTGNDGTVRIWDPATGQQTRDPLIGHTGIVFAVCTLPGTDTAGHPDGRTLLATPGIDGTVRISDPATRRPIRGPPPRSPAAPAPPRRCAPSPPPPPPTALTAAPCWPPPARTGPCGSGTQPPAGRPATPSPATPAPSGPCTPCPAPTPPATPTA